MDLFNAEMEQQLVGGVLLDPLQASEIDLPAEAFYVPENRAIWTAVQSLAGKPFTTATLKAALGSALTPKVAGVLVEAESSVFTSHGLDEVAEHVAGLAVRRRVVAAADAAAKAARDGKLSPSEVLDRAERAMLEAALATRSGEPVSLEQVIGESLAVLQRIQAQGETTGVTTGIPSLDERTTGMQAGELWVLAARPGIGKSALALQAITKAAERGTGAVLFSLEMPRTQLGIRAITGEAGVDQARAKRPKGLSDYDYQRLTEAATRLWTLPVWVEDSGHAGVAEVRAKARRLKSRSPNLGLVVVDYLQLMAGGGNRGESREREVATISRGLKQLAKELGLPVLALSQLSRKAEEQKRRPMLSDLRESGAIEQDADVVVFIHREHEAKPEGPDGSYASELVVAKQRNGPVGTVPVTFQSRLTRFVERAGES